MLWSWRDGKRLAWSEKLTGVLRPQFSPDGASVAMGFNSGMAQIRNAASGEVLATLKHEGQSALWPSARTGDAWRLRVAPRGSGMSTGKAFLEAVLGHPQQIQALMFNRKGDRLITACDDKLVRVFAVESIATVESASVRAGGACTAGSAPALVDEDRILVTVSGESELTRWDMATGKPVTKPIQTWAWNLRGVVASPDGKWFATAGYNGAELHAADGKHAPVHLGHTNTGHEVRLQPRQHDAAHGELGSDGEALVGSRRPAARPTAAAHGKRGADVPGPQTRDTS